MKPQSTKMFFAFIIIMVFSISFLQAQICKDNKVLMHIGGTKYRCHSMCVPNSQVDKYLSQGWFYGPCPPIFPGIANSNSKVSNEKIPAENDIVSKKIFRK